MTDDWQGEVHTLITQETTVNTGMWEMQHNIVFWGLFQDSDFAGDLEDSKSMSGRVL